MAQQPEIEIIGIDPAPGKKSTVYDGKGFHDLNVESLIEYFRAKEKLNNILICWDAPLSGPDVIDEKSFYGSYSDRPIEKTLRKAIGKVEGCSVLPYSGCPHWTVSRAVLGYPIMGKFDQQEKQLPFKKLRSVNDSGKLVVEVHPAVSMFFWSGKNFEKYKGSGRTKSQKQEAIKKNFKAVRDKLESILSIKFPNIETDDELDAFIAYLMGYLWVNHNDKVQLVGNEDKGGAMLLPKKDKIIKKVNSYLKELLSL